MFKTVNLGEKSMFTKSWRYKRSIFEEFDFYQESMFTAVDVYQESMFTAVDVYQESMLNGQTLKEVDVYSRSRRTRSSLQVNLRGGTKQSCWPLPISP